MYLATLSDLNRSIMAYEIIRIDLSGTELERVEDTEDLLDDILSYEDRSGFPFLSSIDAYGFTTFNRRQMDPFLEEWTRFKAKINLASAHTILDRVEDMATKCRSEPHTYLKFIGE